MGTRAEISELFDDVSIYGTKEFHQPCEFIICSVDGTYRVYNKKGRYVDVVLKEGLQYYIVATKITDTSDAALSAGVLAVQF